MKAHNYGKRPVEVNGIVVLPGETKDVNGDISGLTLAVVEEKKISEEKSYPKNKMDKKTIGD